MQLTTKLSAVEATSSSLTYCPAALSQLQQRFVHDCTERKIDKSNKERKKERRQECQTRREKSIELTTLDKYRSNRENTEWTNH